MDFFFALSGFILVHAYKPLFAGGKFSYFDFLQNRFARTYPLHFFTVLVFVSIYLLAGIIDENANLVGQNWQQLPFHVFLLHAWGVIDSHSWNFPSWSVSAEYFAYLLFPLFLQVTRIPALVGLFASYCLFLSVYFVLANYDISLTSLMFNYGILRIFVEFSVGVFVYLCCSNITFSYRLSNAMLIASFALLLASLPFGLADAVSL